MELPRCSILLRPSDSAGGHPIQVDFSLITLSLIQRFPDHQNILDRRTFEHRAARDLEIGLPIGGCRGETRSSTPIPSPPPIFASAPAYPVIEMDSISGDYGYFNPMIGGVSTE